jgi:hypothetical protein
VFESFIVTWASRPCNSEDHGGRRPCHNVLARLAPDFGAICLRLCRANLYFLALGACLALFFWFAASVFACFCAACLCVAFGDLSPMNPRLKFILTNVNHRACIAHKSSKICERCRLIYRSHIDGRAGFKIRICGRLCDG